MMLAVAACGIAARYHSEQQSDTTRENTEKFSETSCIEDFDCVRISYPRFIEDMNAVGAAFKEAR